MLKFFNMKREDVDKMEKEDVYKLLWLEERWKQKQAAEQKRQTQNGKRKF